MAWFECHFKLVADQFEAVAIVLLVPHALFRFDLMGFLAMELLAVGACILFGLSCFSFFCFTWLPCNLERWDFLHSRARGLHSSLDELLSEHMPYINLVYAKLVSSSIMAWR